MTDQLIPLDTTGNNEFPVNARDLYDFLDIKQKFADWIPQRIRDYKFTQGVDYQSLSKTPEGGGRRKEYIFTMDMGKELSMLEANERGQQARRYFIECEKGLKEIASIPDFTNAVEAARAWADSQEKLLESTQAIEAQTKHIQEIEPKAKYADDVLSSKNSYATTVIASQLGMSAIKLNRFLVEKSVQRKVSECWVLCVKYQNKGYDDILTGTIEGSTTSRSYKQLRWTELGQRFIIDLWNSCNSFKLEG
jgi:anti-repressor protein